MVADTVQTFGVLAMAAGDFNHYFGVLFGGCGKVTQAKACFDAFALGGQFNTGWSVFFGIDGARGEAEKPAIYIAV